MKTLFFAFCALLGVSLYAAPTNYVIVVELSPGMGFRREATARTAQDLVRTGIHERIRPAEKLEIWFYDRGLYADIMGAPWDPDRAGLLGTEAAKAIRSRQSQFTPRPDKALLHLEGLLSRSDEVTAMIFTDGLSPFLGTPFDDQINEAFASNYEKFAAEAKPFLITLLGRDEQWVGFGVHTNLGAAVELPKFPKRTIVVRQEPPPTKVEPESVQKAEVKVATAPPPEPPVDNPAPPPVQIERKPEPKPEPPKKVEPFIITSNLSPEKLNIVFAKKEPPKPVTPTPAPEPKPVAATSPPVAQPATNFAAVQAIQTPPGPKFPWPLLLAALGIIAAGGVFAYMRLKEAEARNTPSLISQALDSSKDESLPRLPGSPGMRLKIRLPPANPPVEQERPKRNE